MVPDVHLSDYLRVLRAWKWWITLASVTGAGIGVCVALWMSPVYRAEAVIFPVATGGGSGMALADRLGGMFPGFGVSAGNNTSRQQVAILTSRAFTVRVIEHYHLLPELFPDRWDAATKTWRDGVEPTQWQAYRRMRQARSVEEDRKTGLFTVAIEWQDPNLAARWVDLHIRALNHDLQQQAIASSEKIIADLTEQANQTGNVDMRAALFRLIESETKRGVLARVSDEYAFGVIDPPVAPDRKVRPNRKLIVLLGTGTGFGGMTFAAFFAEYLASSRQRRHLAAGAATPVSRV
ncbi:MAG: Wzz/FepE/Etk N-terminal domain-containing protein [Nitrospirota bacterium]|nr:Wzz/FepE/Etk N-terminal domain-containing protein [Nitrospirota bacterium]